MRIAVIVAIMSLTSTGALAWQPKVTAPPNYSPIPVQSMACGFPPPPPLGCHAVCTCDQTGARCGWSFQCGR